MNIYEKAKQFAKINLEKASLRSDLDSSFPTEAFSNMKEEGFLNLLIPKDMGGLGLGAKEHQQVILAFAEENPSATLCYMMHNVAVNAIIHFATETVKDKIIRDVIENGKFLALANSEFGTGTNFSIPETTCMQKNDHFVFNGTKSMVTSATYASYYLFLSQFVLDKSKTTYWTVPIETEGVCFEMSKWNGVGMRGNVSCPMRMKNVILSSDWRLANDGDGPLVSKVVTNFFILGLASVYSGLNIRLSNLTVRHSVNRKYPKGSGLPNVLADINIVQMYLSKIYAKAQSSRTLAEDAAEAVDRNDDDAMQKVIAARVIAIENAMESATLAMRVGGGITYNSGTEIEKLMRDAYAGQIMAPSLDVLHITLGKLLAGK